MDNKIYKQITKIHKNIICTPYTRRYKRMYKMYQKFFLETDDHGAETASVEKEFVYATRQHPFPELTLTVPIFYIAHFHWTKLCDFLSS